MSHSSYEEHDSVCQRVASLLDLDLLEVKKRTEDNRRSNYGVALVAGHGLDRSTVTAIYGWRKELNKLTSGKINLDSVFTHCTVAKVCRAKCTKKRAAASVPKVKVFDGILKAI
jgi:hypothetical protein